MMPLTRRRFLATSLGFVVSGLAAGAYAVGVEPFRLRTPRHQIKLEGWAGDPMVIALVADPHACEPWMSRRRLNYIVSRTNALQPDMILLLGDYNASHRFVRKHVPVETWATAFSAFNAPLGVHAILGNHDWWDDNEAQQRGEGPVRAARALQDVGIPVYENDVVRLEFKGQKFWLAGLGDQLALFGGKKGSREYIGVDDLDGTLDKIDTEDPIILMAHEPDIFPRVPGRVGLTVSGHTHGGQVRLAGYSPKVPSRYGNRYAYGLVTEPDDNGRSRNLVVSGGLGCSIMPVRFGSPPEITVLEVS